MYSQIITQKKLSVILGGLCTIVGLIIYINGYGFTQMAIAIGLISIGDSGKSGTVQAILVNTLREQNDFFQINNYTTYIANALSAVIIGFLFKINHQYPFYISLSCEIILIFLILTIKNKDQIPSQKNTFEEDNKLNLKTVLYFFSKYKFIFFILFISYFFIPQLSVFFPVYLETQKIPVE